MYLSDTRSPQALEMNDNSSLGCNFNMNFNGIVLFIVAPRLTPSFQIRWPVNKDFSAINNAHIFVKKLLNAIGKVFLNSFQHGHRIKGESLWPIYEINFLKILEIVDCDILN